MRQLRGFLVFGACAAAVALTLALAGSTYATDRYGDAAARAWRLGCLVTFVASFVSGAAVAVASGREVQGVVLALGTMLLRLLVLAPAAIGAVVFLGLEIRPFLLAVAFSYLALLVVDTLYALFAARAASS